MPAFIGPVQILNIAGSGIVQFGDALFISPKAIQNRIPAPEQAILEEFWLQLMELVLQM